MKGLVRQALVDLMPSGGPLPGIEETDWDGFLDRFKREATPLVWAGTVATALLYDLSPILTVKRPVRARNLPPDLKDAHANAISDHPIYLVRQAVFLLKVTGGFAWGADPAVRRAMNLEPYGDDPMTWRQ